MAIGKRTKKIREGIDRTKLYPIAEAIKLVKERAQSKFDETIEIAMNLGVDPRHADQMVRGVVTLPNGTGRTLRVGVFARGAKADEAKAAGADVVGAEDLVALSVRQQNLLQTETYLKGELVKLDARKAELTARYHQRGIAEANLLAARATKKLNGDVVNVACGVRVSVNELAPMMCELFGRPDLKPVHAPERAGDVKHSQADLTKVRQVLGYEPVVNFRDGLRATVEWYKQVLR